MENSRRERWWTGLGVAILIPIFVVAVAARMEIIELSRGVQILILVSMFAVGGGVAYFGHYRPKSRRRNPPPE